MLQAERAAMLKPQDMPALFEGQPGGPCKLKEGPGEVIAAIVKKWPYPKEMGALGGF